MITDDSIKASKVLGNRLIDLGKSSNLKEPGFIKTFAEQLTLIEYSCYNEITRRYARALFYCKMYTNYVHTIENF